MCNLIKMRKYQATLNNMKVSRLLRNIYVGVPLLISLFPIRGMAQSILPPCPSDGKIPRTNCYGVDNYERGASYVGEFRYNKRHGYGTYTKKGDIYIGNFKNNLFDGLGVLSFSSGNKYVGEFRNGKFYGKGTFTWADGEKYIGEFRDDKFHGLGIMLTPNGSVRDEGIWKNDEFLRKTDTPFFDMVLPTEQQIVVSFPMQSGMQSPNGVSTGTTRTVQPASRTLNCEMEGREIVCKVNNKDTRISSVSLMPASCKSPMMETENKLAVEKILNSFAPSKRAEIEKNLTTKTNFAMGFAQDSKLALPMLAWLTDPTGVYQTGEKIVFSSCVGLQSWTITVNGVEEVWKLQ